MKMVKIYLIFVFLLSFGIGYLSCYAYGNETSIFIFENLRSKGLFKGRIMDFIGIIYSLTLLINIIMYS